MVKQASQSINSADPNVVIESEGRALRRAHTIDEAVATKPDDSGLAYGDKVREAIKCSAN